MDEAYRARHQEREQAMFEIRRSIENSRPPSPQA